MSFIDVLDDPRKNINTKYNFLDIIFWAICAVIFRRRLHGMEGIKMCGVFLHSHRLTLYVIVVPILTIEHISESSHILKVQKVYFLHPCDFDENSAINGFFKCKNRCHNHGA
ncbi:hypothetical protein [Photorhabdus khanii]|uniref:Uncharacterized protein n=1 Tax=Photorhabdus khanii subsp. guanajuatensis TaxID=2100166 RepID=A0A4R4IPP0_9GAMM|nr:hypothetical protein [Photorhabdus khanii]TDB42588.1 hypothetical protein C5467_23815 [Photorhabdus khanii subsp. guanajuatensis]